MLIDLIVVLLYSYNSRMYSSSGKRGRSCIQHKQIEVTGIGFSYTLAHEVNILLYGTYGLAFVVLGFELSCRIFVPVLLDFDSLIAWTP